MLHFKSRLTLNFSRIFRKWLDRVIGLKVENCPRKQKTDLRENGSCIASFAYECRIRILDYALSSNCDGGNV